MAVGHYSHPRNTSIVGFTGAQIHSHSWEGPIGCVGKKVLLVGTGDSATDIAAILIKFGVGSLHISIRNNETFADWEDLPEEGFCEVGNLTYANGMFSWDDTARVWLFGRILSVPPETRCALCSSQ